MLNSHDPSVRGDRAMLISVEGTLDAPSATGQYPGNYKEYCAGMRARWKILDITLAYHAPEADSLIVVLRVHQSRIEHVETHAMQIPHLGGAACSFHSIGN